MQAEGQGKQGGGTSGSFHRSRQTKGKDTVVLVLELRTYFKGKKRFSTYLEERMFGNHHLRQ